MTETQYCQTTLLINNNANEAIQPLGKLIDDTKALIIKHKGTIVLESMWLDNIVASAHSRIDKINTDRTNSLSILAAEGYN
tara:strand:- start:2699 stop:2941 length:243 start_codon:yes stop_codon:yes gene_type:complete